jgi:polyvinyl alcohol dehydrogenase (cytochrome)
LLCLTTVCGACGSDGAGRDITDAILAQDGGEPEPPPPRAALPRAESTHDWTWLGGDLGSSYHAKQERVLNAESAYRLQEAWMRDLGVTINGAAVVVGEHIYVSEPQAVHKLNAETGEEIWNARPGGVSAPSYVEGVLYVHAYSDSLSALDAETGESLWRVAKVSQVSLAVGFSSPLVAEDRVIVGTSSGEESVASVNAVMFGEVVAFDRHDGAELWRHRIAEEGTNGATVWSSPSADPEAGMLFVCTGNNYTGIAGGSSDAILALDLATGERLWTRQLTEGDVYTTVNPNGNPDYDFGSNPVLFEAELDGKLTRLVGAGQKSGVFHALRRDTGEVVWSREVSPGSALGGILNNGAYDGARILVAGNTSIVGPTANLVALDPASGERLWRISHRGKVWAPITIAHGVALVMFDTTLVVVDVTDGRVLYEYETPATSSTAPVVSDGWVYFGSGIASFPTSTAGTTYHALKVVD